MSTFTVVAVTLALLLPSLAQQAAPPAVSPSPDAGVHRLAWLTGCWKQARAKGHTEEHWMAPAGGTMLGMSRTVMDGKTVEYEFIRIEPVNGVLAYVAMPSRQAEAAFPLASLDAGSVVFENRSHDFPQRIAYRRNPDGSMTARIEGTVDGQSRSREFPYQACGR
jgi:hypothetical protein